MCSSQQKGKEKVQIFTDTIICIFTNDVHKSPLGILDSI